MTDEEINNSIETNELSLTSWGKFTHYGIVYYLLFIPVVVLFVYFKNLVTGTSKGINVGILLFLIVPSVIAFLFYKLQRDRLRFHIVQTTLTRAELDKIIQNVSKELQWKIFKTDKKIVVAKTFPGFFSGSWGEQITIIFDNQRVLVNSICDPDNHSSVVSMGRNKMNTNTLINEIEKAQEAIVAS